MGRRVLVVDDDPDLREMMAQLLALEGFDASTAANGRDALDRLDAGPIPQVILLDLMMPVMDGRQFLKECRRIPACAGIPVIVLSAASDRAPVVKADAIFKKPLDFGRLVDTVRHYASPGQRP
jgi:CheY-like chemotaxis protein